MLQEIIETIYASRGNDYIFFNTNDAIKVKLSPHTPAFEIHGLCVSPDKELYVMDSGGAWNKLEESDVNADKLIVSIYQRIKIMFKTHAAC